jgi:hypothetical protein
MEGNRHAYFVQSQGNHENLNEASENKEWEMKIRPSEYGTKLLITRTRRFFNL